MKQQVKCQFLRKLSGISGQPSARYGKVKLGINKNHQATGRAITKQLLTVSNQV